MTATGGRTAGVRLGGRLEDELRARAGEWFPQLRGAVEVTAVRSERRTTCLLHRIELGDGVESVRVLAKVRVAEPVRRPGDDAGRPQLVPAVPISPSERAAREFAGLRRAARAVEEATARPGAPPLCAVRPLLLLEDEQTVVMDYLGAPSLRSCTLRRSRLLPHRAPTGAPDVPWRAAGAWLRHYQQPADPALPTRAEASAEVLDQLRSLADHLGSRLADGALAGTLHRCADALGAHLPATFPLGVSHGDLAARNILVDTGGRVAVLDPMPRWRAPVYDDLARLVVTTRVGEAQLVSGGAVYGAGLLDRIERAALDGYFGAQPVPHLEVALFQLLVLLDAWAGALARGRSAARRLAAVPAGHWYRREVRRLVHLLADRAQVAGVVGGNRS